MRRWSAVLLTLMMLMPLAVMLSQAQTVRAADAHLDDGGWEWHFVDTSDATKAILTRVVRVGTASTEVNIPAHLSGTIDLLTFAASCFADTEGRKITKVLSMPSTITSIGSSVFYGCASLTSVSIGSGVTSIGGGAFQSCTSLTSVTIPNSVTSIGTAAFYYCTLLTSVTIGSGVTIIGGNAFRDCSALTSVTIPNSVTTIGIYAFDGCSGMTSVNIGTGVTTIGTEAFYQCSALTSVTIPNNVASIGNYAFAYCTALTTINFPNSAMTLGDGVFAQCTHLPSLTLPIISSIGNYEFYNCIALTSITIPSGVTSIGIQAFYSCTSLLSITFSGLVAPISVGANWIQSTPVPIRGHAYAASNFPTPGNAFYGLTMGTVIYVWTPLFTNSTVLNYTMHSGTIHTTELFPIIAELNATHDLYLIEFDTWTDVHNVSILGESTWDYLFSTPWCSSVTEAPPYLNLAYVVEGVTYRVYFAVPVTRICQVHFAIWVSSTGEGVPFETFHLRYSLGTVYNTSIGYDVVADTEYLAYGENWTVTVLDYFGNMITTQTFMTTGEQNYVSIPINVYSVKVFNQKEDFTKVRIYYNHTGVPLTYYAAPMEPVERFLRGGNYTFIITFYDDHTAGSSESFVITVTDAEFLMVQGDTISRVISDVAGVKALQQIITTIVTPDTVFIAQQLPFVPTEPVLYIHPWSIVTATMLDAGNGTHSHLDTLVPNVTGSTSTVIKDQLFLMGSGGWWLNYSTGTAFLNGTSSAIIDMDGENLVLNSSSNVAYHRETKWRLETLFYFSYYTLQKKYLVTLQLNNSLTQNMSSIDWFIGFPDGRSIDTSSVRVYDLDNDLYLTMGTHYDVTAAGIRMAFDELNASDARSFQFTFYDSNATQGQGLAIAYADSYVATQLGDESYYMSHASWTNSFPYEYNGQVQVRLNFKDGEQRYIDPSDVVVRDVNANRNLDPTEFTVAAGVITIDNANVEIGEVQSYDVYFKLDMTGKDKFNVLDAAFYFGSFGVSWVMLLFVFALVLGGLYVWKKWVVVGYFALIIVAVTLILWYFAQTVGGI